MVELAVIGGGPAGLRVAELAARAGFEVKLYDQKRSVGRKFLIAGKSGLNLTNAARRDEFLSVYQGADFPRDLWAEIFDRFDNDALRDWALSHGQETFVSSGKKVFPESMKAAPLLRSWVQSIKAAGALFQLNHSFKEIEPVDDGYRLMFHTPEGESEVLAKRVVFALGGGSWSRTGSDGRWVNSLSASGISVSPLQSANCGWEIEWPLGFLDEYEGQPWKNIVCKAGKLSLEGELVITKYGLEGGPIYRLGHELRKMDSATLEIDFKPTFSVERLLQKVESVRRNLADELSRRWKVQASVVSLLAYKYPEIFTKEVVPKADLAILAEEVKCLEMVLQSARPIEEAISCAGGIRWEALDDALQIRNYPNVYACGEMLDWEAPTGGYLLQGCMSSATWVAKGICAEKFD